MGTEFLKIMEVFEVEKVLQELFQMLYSERKVENIPLEKANKRVLAEDIYATINLPPFNRASRDGYAVKVQDTFAATDENPVILDLLETIEAGMVPQKEVNDGQCTEISTGAPMPEGADGLVMVEFTEKVGDKIHIYKSVHHGEFVAEKGADIEEGKLLLKKGSVLSPDKIGVLSAIGCTEITVVAKPTVAVISTGNELIKSHDKLEYGKIYDVNSLSIQSAVKSCGATPIFGGIVKDSYSDLKKAIENALQSSDMVITSGGTSAGVGDFLRQVLDDMGEVLVHGISIKPGKPTLVAQVKNKVVIGLPGYPVAALTIFQVFMEPILRKLGGFELSPENETLKLPLAGRFYSSKGRMQYVLVRILEGEVHPILKDSGAITALAEADGYMKVPKNVEIVQEGSEVEVTLFNRY
jgi:molybdopterin molybdotransferase